MECDLEVRSFKDVCNVCGFSADICKIGPLLCGVSSYKFIWARGWDLCDFIGKKLL